VSRPKPPAYRTTNWHDYNAALARRGSLSIWFDPETQWLAAPTGTRASTLQLELPNQIFSNLVCSFLRFDW